MADRRLVASRMLGIDRHFRHFHDHRLDPVYGGRTYVRLPDGTPVPLDRYEERLAAYRAEETRRREEG